MNRYLIFSSSFHFILIFIFFLISENGFANKKAVYYIDFIGAPQIVNASNIGVSKRRKPKTAIKKKKEEKIKKEEDFTLPKPSMLKDTKSLFFAPKKEPEIKNAASSEKETPAAITTDFANFPYPWYISKIRQILSEQWGDKMPSAGKLRAVVKFNILRDGSIKKLKVEKSSGNRLFDYAALSAAETSAPFDELPGDFMDTVLTVHVEFKTTN